MMITNKEARGAGITARLKGNEGGVDDVERRHRDFISTEKALAVLFIAAARSLACDSSSPV
jgi:hypothetical protein